jgi:hypothetical protein
MMETSRVCFVIAGTTEMRDWWSMSPVDEDPADICSGPQVRVGLPKSKRAIMEMYMKSTNASL